MLIMDVLGNEDIEAHALPLWEKHIMTIDEWCAKWSE
jgi:hypothetical protein